MLVDAYGWCVRCRGKVKVVGELLDAIKFTQKAQQQAKSEVMVTQTRITPK